MIWVGRGHKAHLSWARIPSSRPGCSEPCTTSECKSNLSWLWAHWVLSRPRDFTTHAWKFSLCFYSAGSGFGIHSQRPLALPHPFKADIPMEHILMHLWSGTHCSCLPSCTVTLRKLYGCSRQQQGPKYWSGERYTVDVAVACSWTSPVCKNGTLAGPHQW